MRHARDGNRHNGGTRPSAGVTDLIVKTQIGGLARLQIAELAVGIESKRPVTVVRENPASRRCEIDRLRRIDIPIHIRVRPTRPVVLDENINQQRSVFVGADDIVLSDGRGIRRRIDGIELNRPDVRRSIHRPEPIPSLIERQSFGRVTIPIEVVCVRRQHGIAARINDRTSDQRSKRLRRPAIIRQRPQLRINTRDIARRIPGDRHTGRILDQVIPQRIELARDVVIRILAADIDVIGNNRVANIQRRRARRVNSTTISVGLTIDVDSIPDKRAVKNRSRRVIPRLKRPAIAC